MSPLESKKPKGLSATVVFVITLVISLAFLTLWSTEGDGGLLHSARSVAATVASPFQMAGSFIGIPFNAVSGTNTASASSTDLLALQQENDELRAENAQLEEYKLENERLTKLLDLQTSYGLTSTGARVISRSSDSWNRSVTIDKGSASGITVGMPVMSTSGLIGQVESVSLNTATVRLITDESSGVAVYLQNSRSEGIVEGSVTGLLYLNYVSTSVEVSIGESVITSGLGGVYPKGIVVGVVTRVDGEATDAYHTIVIEPLASSNVSEEVLVVTGDETETTTATAEENAAASSATSGDGTSVDSAGGE